MKVLLINWSDIVGGAGIAGHRLYRGLLNHGIDAKILAAIAQSEDENINILTPKRSFRLWEKIKYRIGQRIGVDCVYLDRSSVVNHDFYKKADILNLHNLHGDFFNYLTLPKLTRSKPSVYTLHDMWSFTGHCGYSYDCEKWRNGCGGCSYPDSYPPIARDSTRMQWRIKKWVYSHSKLTIVTLSRWLTEQARESMLNCFPIYHIPNGIDTDIYRPLDKGLCREVLNIPRDFRVLMFTAHYLLKDARKGGNLLLNCLKSLPQSYKARTMLLTVGHGGDTIEHSTGMKTLNLGYVGGDQLKALCYSAADIFVFPTRADNLPLVLQESMACGTPMVSFNIGGVSDLVRHGITGYLAEPDNAESLMNAIVRLLDDDALREKMSKACRAVALEEYDIKLQVQKYMKLFRDILK